MYGFCPEGPDCKFYHVKSAINEVDDTLDVLANLLPAKRTHHSHKREKVSQVCHKCGDTSHSYLFCPLKPYEHMPTRYQNQGPQMSLHPGAGGGGGVNGPMHGVRGPNTGLNTGNPHLGHPGAAVSAAYGHAAINVNPGTLPHSMHLQPTPGNAPPIQTHVQYN